MRVHRRLQKLELQFFDGTGLAAHSREWVAHWEAKIDQLIAGEKPDLHGMPLVIVDSIIDAGDLSGWGPIEAEHRRPKVLFSVQAVRAVMQWSDNPASLVGSISDDDGDRHV